MSEPGDSAERVFIETTGWDGDAIAAGFAWLLRYAIDNGHSQAAIAVGVKDQVRRMKPALPEPVAGSLYKSGEVKIDGLTLSLILDRRRPFDFPEVQSSLSGRTMRASRSSMT